MLRYIRIRDDLSARVDALVNRGDYPDFNSVATTALENLITAEEEFASDQTLSPKGDRRGATRKSPQGLSSTAETPPCPGPSVSWDNRLSLPVELIVPAEADDIQPGQLIPLERWLFGQENRAFPAKVNARLFVSLVLNRESPIELNEAAREISVAAANVFSLLHEMDLRNGHQKDDLLSTGFPQPGSEKSATRYANQFVAYENTQGRLSGMMIEWKLAGVKRAKTKTYLHPTQACIDFAAFENLLLDRQPSGKVDAKFAEEEIGWVLRHISTNVPVEAFAFKTILTGIESGAKSPDTLDDYVRAHATEKPGLTKEFVSTQRTGAVSRMADLNMVMRVREGIRIFYEMTERGKEWLKTQKHQPTV